MSTARAASRAQAGASSSAESVVGGPSPPAPPLVEDLHALGALSGFAVLLAAWGYPLWGGAWEMLCPLREITGIPCPTCYGTRALVAAAAGHWATALRFNPLVAVAGIGLLAYVPGAAAVVAAGWPRPRVPEFLVRYAAPTACSLVLANWAYLLIAHR